MLAQLAAIGRALGQATDRRRSAGAEIGLALDSAVHVLSGAYPDDAAEVDSVELARRWEDLVEVFRLTTLESVLLAVAAAADVDLSAATAYGELQGLAGPAAPSIGLAFELAGIAPTDPGRAALDPTGALRRHGLLAIGEGPFPARSLLVADRVVSHLLGSDDLAAETTRAAIHAVPVETRQSALIAAHVEAGNTLTYLRSPLGAAGVAVATAALADIDISWLAVDLTLLPDAERVPAGYAAVRDAALRRHALVAVLPSSPLLLPGIIAALAAAPVPVIAVCASDWDRDWLSYLPPVVRIEPLDDAIRTALWRQLAPELPTPGGPDRRRPTTSSAPASDAPTFRLAPEAIRDVVLRSRADAHAAGRELQWADLDRLASWTAVAHVHQPGVRRVKAAATFADLVLPRSTSARLADLIGRARLRERVIGDHPIFGLGGQSNGVSALFAGPSGTGKTMAAHAVAAELGRELLVVDLAAVVDKYIGETEKHLEQAFELAEITAAVLFFDEADALFGSRSKVSDARDRYANQETAWLLQRLEAFAGVTVLASNLRANLDRAFTRRLSLVIPFDPPSAELQAELWRRYLTGLDTDPADPIDIDALVRIPDVSGGEIRNIALSAIYAAAEEDAALGLRHLGRAFAAEFDKLGRRLPDSLSVGASRAPGSPAGVR